MKIAVTGKGGSGKTTVAAALCALFSEEGRKVIAVDCDPDMSLGVALDFAGAQDITPISQMKDLIAERTESDADRPGGFFKLNPKVDDIPLKFSPEHNGVRLMVMGKVNKASGGCLCPENTFIKRLISHLVVAERDIVILDMVAGTEHLGRGTAEAVDAFLIVTEPTLLGVNTAKHIKELAKDLGIKKIFFVGNKMNTDEDKNFLKKHLNQELIGAISFSHGLSENRGKFVFDERLKEEFKALYAKLILRRIPASSPEFAQD